MLNNKAAFTPGLDLYSTGFGALIFEKFTPPRMPTLIWANAPRTRNKNNREGMNYSGELLYRRKFRKIGRTLTVGLRNGYNESESDNSSIAPNTVYNPDGSVLYYRDQDQKGEQDTKANNH